MSWRVTLLDYRYDDACKSKRFWHLLDLRQCKISVFSSLDLETPSSSSCPLFIESISYFHTSWKIYYLPFFAALTKSCGKVDHLSRDSWNLLLLTIFKINSHPFTLSIYSLYISLLGTHGPLCPFSSNSFSLSLSFSPSRKRERERRWSFSSLQGFRCGTLSRTANRA